MKMKLISLCVSLICLSAAVSAGFLSIYRSEGRVLSPETQEKIEAFLDQHGIELPAFLTE